LTTSTAAPVEILPGRLWALGDVIPLDGSVTWAPADGGYQPLNSYLVRNGDDALLVDSGPKIHEQVLMDQLEALLAPGSRVTVFITRAEFDCMGGLPAVAARYEIERILTGGSQSPLDDLVDIPRFGEAWNRRVALGKSVIVGLTMPGDLQAFEDAGGLDVIAPALRVLATFWGYHRPSRTLFTTDVFGHTSIVDPSDARVIVAAEDDTVTPESVRRHLLAKYFWLPQANPSAILENLRRIFGEREIDVIAPSHGCVLRGRDVVRRHYELLRQAIQPEGARA
jgi:flavorubredoxin